AGPGRADHHPAGDGRPQPGGTDRSGRARAHPAGEGRRPRRGVHGPPQPLPRAILVNTTPPPMLIVVSGMSGSGKSVALKTLEDLGFYCVDNLPADLLPDFVRSVANGDGAPQKLAVGIDVRNRHSDLSNIPEWLSTVGTMGLDPRLVFFDTEDMVLLRRYADTRR